VISFRWSGRYRHDSTRRRRSRHDSASFAFQPEDSAAVKSAPFVFLANIDPRLQLDVLRQVKQAELSPATR